MTDAMMLHRCDACGGSWYEGEEHRCTPEGTAPCRRCGGTGGEPEEQDHRCHQCFGEGWVRQGDTNEATAQGLKRLASAALAASPVPEKTVKAPVAYMVVWDKVNGNFANTQMLEMLKRCYPRRNRKEQKTYNKLVRRMMGKGLLIPATDNLPT